MTITEYIKELNTQLSTSSATEHSYRPALKSLLDTMLPKEITVVNEPKRSDCGAPDYILQRGDGNIPVAFIEAKDFVKSNDLGGRKENKEQFDRYKKSLDNIVFTDYLDFWYYESGEFVDSVKIAELRGDKIVAVADSEAKFESLILKLAQAAPQSITSSSRLAEIMAGKARLLADVVQKVIVEDSKSGNDSDLCERLEAFKEILINDLTPESFSDIYAQTIAYGMFAARLHDKTPDTFSRQEAATLIPKTNPFLRSLFQSIAGYDLDERIAWIVDDLAEIFRATDVVKVMSGYGQRTRQTDPILHFYEDFLSAYDPALRKSRGVWYTPQPVVNYIVRAVDEILQKEFNLPMGLADTSKAKMKVANQKARKKDDDTYEIEVPRVQVLDPATGTGTFLAEVVSTIHDKMKSQQGMWQSYVEEHLLPRLNGFEILMASYAMAHLKLDLLLGDTGYVANNDKRLKVFLTNSLEESHKDAGTLFGQELSREASHADVIKRDTPVMVVLGNPPYSGISKNNGEWISNMIDDYKFVNGKPLNERKHWLNDDYVKFIRLGQSFVDRTNEGVLAYVNNHSFLDNTTFRGMRWNLMQEFDKIYIIDLHGNSKKNETCADGSKDENVFDIMQGVSINIFVKTGKKKADELADVYHLDLYGRRASKYDYLSAHTLSNTDFVKLEPNEPYYFFVPRNEDSREEYEQGFGVNELFSLNTTGVVTARDGLVIDIDKNNLLQRIEDFCDISHSDRELRDKYWSGKKDGKYLAGDSRGWQLSTARTKIADFEHNNIIKQISYRPFDDRYIYYSPHMVDWGREKVMQHMLAGDNVGLVFRRQQPLNRELYIFVTSNLIADGYIRSDNKGGESVSPLYLYPTDGQTTTDGAARTPNLKPEIVAEVAKQIGRTFENEKSGDSDKFAPIDLLDYIYGVLHTQSYRDRYKEFLKIDFPRIPYPESADKFFEIAAIGGELRRVHLMEELPAIDVPFRESGSGVIEFVSAVASEVEGELNIYINDTQYFGGVPQIAWEQYIGGYQPAQKWLKDRKGKKIIIDDTMHYQRIIAALLRTTQLMQQL